MFPNEEENRPRLKWQRTLLYVPPRLHMAGWKREREERTEQGEIFKQVAQVYLSYLQGFGNLMVETF